MKFPNKFFEGEEREGFYVEPMMKRAWASQMEILSEIDSVCKKYGIKYFVYFGTLLGTIRHEGFIPWDDDLDIAMLREDYDKFFEVASEELTNLKILSIYHEPEWEVGVGRMTNGSGIILMPDRLQKYHGCPFAMGIDIFPFDYVPDNIESLIEQNKIVEVIENTIRLIECNDEEKNHSKTEIHNNLDELEEAFGFEFNREKYIINQLLCLRDQVYSMYGNRDNEYVTCYELQHRRKKEFKIPTYWVTETVICPFEHILVPVPKYYEANLTLCYGSNFMIPKIGTSGHDYPIYKEQLQFMNDRNLYDIYEKSMGFCYDDYLADTDVNENENSEKNILFLAKDSRKKVIYCVSSVGVYGNENSVSDTITRTLNIFYEKSESISLYFSVDELAINIIEHVNIREARKIKSIKKDYIEKQGKYIEYNNIRDTLNNFDIYYGSYNVFVKEFVKAKKPVMIQNFSDN